MKWPTTQQEYLRLADTLRQLVGGRTDVVARYYDFEGENGRVKGWGPWKAKKVEADYAPEPHELVLEYPAKERKGIDRWLMRPLSRENLIQHLRGKERLGVYALAKDSTCSFIAADFDDHDGTLKPEAVWAEVRKFAAVCDANNFTPHVEKSKSGKGYHVWIFFDAPVPAGDARAVGKWLFQESQLMREDEDFSTFDRFFPAQAKAGGKQLGNLIGLPLCGSSGYAQGRNAWVHAQTGELLEDATGVTLGIFEQGRVRAGYVREFMGEWSLKADDRLEAVHHPRDPERPLGTLEEFKATLTRCKFLEHAGSAAGAQSLSEPLWYSMVSNAACFAADEWIHEASGHHASYRANETEMKIGAARLAGSGPRRCSTIQDDGFSGCPRGGCKLPNGKATQSPAGLAVWANVREPEAPKNRSRDGAVHVAPELPAGDERPWRDGIPLHPETGEPWPMIHGGFVLDGSGVSMSSGRGMEVIATRPIWVDALTEGTSTGEDGIVIKFFNRRWRLRQYAVPVEMLHEQGGILAKVLHGQGAIILPGKEKWVSRFLTLQESQHNRFILATSRLGWMKAGDHMVFVLPDRVIGTAKDEIVYQSDIPLSYADSLRMEGTLLMWQEQIAKPCRGNPLLMFSLMIGLAGPLLKPVEEQGGGFHYYGTTTGGKTTCGQVCMSIWGNGADPANDSESTAIRTWDATQNAIEGLAELHSHQILVLDELGKTQMEDVGQAIYKLAGGKGKERATISGGLRKPRSWRTLIFSNGEVSLTQMAMKNKQALKGGQLIRIVDIPVDTDTGERGIVVQTQGRDAKVYVEDLKSACSKFYGSAGPTFVAYVLAQYQQHGVATVSGQLREEMKRIENWLAGKLDGTMPPEGRRVLRRFALVALAGMRAGPGMAGILDWTIEEVLAATLKVAQRWLEAIGNARSEQERGVAQLRENMLANINSFIWADEKLGGAREVLGYRVDKHFLVLPKAFAELCGEYDPRQVLASLRDQNLLWMESGRVMRKAPIIRALGNFRPRVYWISNLLLGEDGEAPEEDAAGQITRPNRTPGAADEKPTAGWWNG